jgi:heptosyltransferase-3
VPPIDPQRLERVLVIMLRHHGDVLLTSPLFGALKHRLPRVEVDALVYAHTAPMLRNHPSIAEIHCIDRGWRKAGVLAQAKGTARLLRKLSQRRYDLTIHLTTHWLPAWLNRLLRPRYALAPDFQKEKRKTRLWRGGFTHFYPYRAGPHKHMVAKNLDALRFMGIEPDAEASRLVLRPGDAAYVAARKVLSEAGLAERGFVAVHPTSRLAYKCWREEALAEVLDHLAARGWPVALTPAPDEVEMGIARRIVSACRRARPQILNLNLQELAATIDLATLHLGVDSVAMHIAAAMQTPSVALFGPTEPAEWGPWMSPHRVISSRAFPRPDGESVRDPHFRHSLVNIPVEAVVRAVEEMLPRERAAVAAEAH